MTFESLILGAFVPLLTFMHMLMRTLSASLIRMADLRSCSRLFPRCCRRGQSRGLRRCECGGRGGGACRKAAEVECEVAGVTR